MRRSLDAKRGLLGSATVLMVSVSLLAGCTTSPRMAEGGKKKRSKEYFAESVYGVKASPRVSNKRSNLPRGGGRDQTGKPYQVRGKWYHPKEDKNYRKVGQASWYGDAFHGRLTANGEVYDMTNLTAAHPTMPLPSYARVTNLANGNTVIVRVNDRGPYDSGRIIDLSRKAADLLGYAEKGTAKVQVEYVGRARMDGKDEQYLMASYRPGGRVPDPSADGLPSGVMIAMNGPSPSRHAPADGNSLQSQLEALSAAPGDLPQLPSEAPVAPERPQEGFGGQAAFATMSYAPAAGGQAVEAFAAFDRASNDTGFVAAATFTRKREAEALRDRLAAFGDARVEKGAKAFEVTLRPDGRLDGDALLRAAWENGAPEAITVRN